MTRILFIVAFTIFLWACQAPVVEQNQLIGEWSADSVSVSHLPSFFRDSEPRLVLRDDGSFSASQLPGPILFALAAADSTLVTGEGIWSMDIGKWKSELVLTFQTFHSGELYAPPFAARIDVQHTRGDIILSDFVGDPDSAPMIKFRKTN